MLAIFKLALSLLPGLSASVFVLLILFVVDLQSGNKRFAPKDLLLGIGSGIVATVADRAFRAQSFSNYPVLGQALNKHLSTTYPQTVLHTVEQILGDSQAVINSQKQALFQPLEPLTQQSFEQPQNYVPDSFDDRTNSGSAVASDRTAVAGQNPFGELETVDAWGTEEAEEDDGFDFQQHQAPVSKRHSKTGSSTNDLDAALRNWNADFSNS